MTSSGDQIGLDGERLENIPAFAAKRRKKVCVASEASPIRAATINQINNRKLIADYFDKRLIVSVIFKIKR